MKYILVISNMPEESKDCHLSWLRRRGIDPHNTFWKRSEGGYFYAGKGKWLYETETGRQIFTKEEFFKPVLNKDMSEYM